MAVQIPAVERARALVRSAVASGTLTRPPACERCAACCPLDAHHADYARPLQVTWLCLSCHLLAHPRPPRPACPGSARARAERELRSDPARSDALIAAAAHCSAQAAGRWRHALERAGVIEAIEPSQRLAIPRAWPPRTPARIAIERHGASTPEQVMRLSGAGFVKVAGGVQPGESPVRSRNCRAWRGSWAQRRVSAV